LGPGTYRFRLADPDSGRKILQVLSKNGSAVHAMFHTRPDSRVTATKTATVTFMETPAGVPPAIRSLFYGGELNGYEFVYPPGGPIMVAEVVPQPEIAYMSTPIPTLPDPRIVPERAAVPKPAALPESAAVAEPAPAQEPSAPPADLPRTATPVPMIALGGVASLLAAFGIGLVRKAIG
jgi:hypothetical protein